MRILKIAFENINSLRGSHTIDFQKEKAFIGSNLFAITGPTGAGKTTILDVITLALYHRTPRLGEVSTNMLDKLGGILTRDTNAAQAEVTFSTPKGIFRAMWGLQREVISRGANKGQFRLEEYSEIVDLQKDTIIASKKKKEVQEEIKKRIGLDYEQFVKAILLSQGDFAAFLKAKREERAELLERITGTEIYRRLGMEAYARWNDGYKQEIEKKQQSLDLQKIISEEDVKGYQDAILEYEELCRKAEAGRTLLEKQLQRKIRIDEIWKTLEKIQKNEWPTWQAAQSQFDEQYIPRLNRHEAAQTFTQQLTNYQLQHQQIQTTTTQVERLLKEQQAAQTNRAQLLNEIARLVGELVSDQSAQGAIERFREKVNTLIHSRQEVTQQWVLAKEQAEYWLGKTEHTELVSCWKREAYANCLLISRDAWKEMQRRQGELRERYQLTADSNLPDLRQHTQNKREALQQLENLVRQYEIVRKRQTDYVRQIVEERKKLTQFEPVLAQAKRKVIEAKNLVQIAQEEQLGFIRETAIPRLKSELKTDEACPVCGSLEHPALHTDAAEGHFSIEQYLQELANLKARFEARERSFSNAENELRHLESTIKAVEATVSTLEREKENAQMDIVPIADGVKMWKTQLNVDKIGRSDEVKAWLLTETERFNHLEELILLQERSESLAHFGKYLKKGLDFFQKQEEYNQELRKLYPRESKYLATECDELLRKLVLKTYSPTQYEPEKIEYTNRLLEQKGVFEQLEKQLRKELLMAGFQEIDHAKAALLSAEVHKSLTEQKEQLQKRKTQLETQIDNLTREVEELLKGDDSDLAMDMLRSRINDYRVDEREYLQKMGGWKQALIENETSRLEHAKSLEEITILEKQYKKWRLLSETLGDREGKKFNQFAQKLTLANLVRSANSRLKDLSERYLLLPPEGEEENLWVLDRNFDERRAVATLSGGETFLVSLALALGLSDMVSKNVKIESLFIDEGFGTLDPDTLEVALNTLERLQAESNRMIGIISHVEALKDRITTQIRLSKDASGFSMMDIIG
ncbi:MAG: AAA family ATPase [Siphonobacter sp.]